METCILLFSVVLVTSTIVQGDEGETLPVWAPKYFLRGMKISLTADLAQDFQYWRNEHSSRIDYNQGATKTFHYDNTIEKNGAIYKVYPKTDEYEVISTACTLTRGTRFDKIEPDSPLPDTQYYEYAGNDFILDREARKYTSDETNDEDQTEIKNTLWAAYDNNTSSWIPLRYEVMEFNTWFGNLKKHNIWIFYNVEIQFNSYLLNYTKYVADCEEPPEDDDMPLDEETSTFLNPNNVDHLNLAFDSFKKRHQRTYKEGEEEHKTKKEIFKKNLELVVSTNRQNLGYKLAMNKLADHTPKQMKTRMGLKRTNREKGNIAFPYTTEQILDESDHLPKEYDTRLLGYVTSVKEQVECGCCWTMGTTAAVEGALARSNGGRLLSLSNQALIDCSWGFGETGCEGGTDTAAYKWMIEYGLPTVEEYGVYNDADGYCKIENMTKLYPIRGFTDVTPYSIEALKVALINHGPLSVSVYASTDTFRLYASGIFYDPVCRTSELNHEVALVGYGEQDGEPFWIIKNSWGPDWGIAGYMHISMRDNNCGVATEPTYVVF